jgi:hypothetical protein
MERNSKKEVTMKTQCLKVKRRPVYWNGYVGRATSTAKTFGPYDDVEAHEYAREMNDRSTSYWYETVYVCKNGEEVAA